MISQKQLAANRQNALKSTGPKSNKGKKKSSMNAFKYGINSNKFLIEGEKKSEFENYKKDFIEELNPTTFLLQEIASQIITTGWKIKRYTSLESVIFNKKHSGNEQKQELVIRWDDSQLEDYDKFFENPIYDNEGQIEIPEPQALQKPVEEKKEKVKNEPIFEKTIPYDFLSVNSIFKLSVMEQRVYNRYYKLLEYYRFEQQKINSVLKNKDHESSTT